MTHDELVARAAHDLRASLAVVAGYSELAFTRDDPALRAEAGEAVSAAVADLTDGVDDVLLALELGPGRGGGRPRRGRPARGRRGGGPAARGEPGRDRRAGEAVRALADEESAVRALQALLRAAGDGPTVVTIGAGPHGATASIEAAGAVPVDGGALALGNARRLAELQRGTVVVAGARLELELPAA